MAKVVLKENGKAIFFSPTPEYSAETARWRTRGCETHSTTEWRKHLTSNGAIQIRRQCLICGYILGNPRKKEYGDDLLPSTDPDAYSQYIENREAELEKITQKHALLQYQRETSWFRNYNAYLESDAWKAKRILVFKRAGGICEGCGEAPATQVHHQTYAHVGNEFLFELVALCDECHNRLHAEDDHGFSTESAPDSPPEFEADHPCNGCRFMSEENGTHWCFISEMSAANARSADGPCGPRRTNFEHLK